MALASAFARPGKALRQAAPLAMHLLQRNAAVQSFANTKQPPSTVILSCTLRGSEGWPWSVPGIVIHELLQRLPGTSRRRLQTASCCCSWLVVFGVFGWLLRDVPSVLPAMILVEDKCDLQDIAECGQAASLPMHKC